MNAFVSRLPGAADARSADLVLRVGLGALAAVHLGLALFMAFDPQAFYKDIGPFGVANEHYVRDVATFYAAFAAGGLIAMRRPAWRAPVLAVMLVEYALHSVNHLADIADAHPAWLGYFDFANILGATLLIAWLLALALSQERQAPTQEVSP